MVTGNEKTGAPVAIRDAPRASATRKTIRDLLMDERMREQFHAALPKQLTVERFVRVALTTINKVPRLAECTQESLLACLLDCASLGIEPDGRRAHLIPFRDNKRDAVVCSLIIDYKGYIELARRSGELSVWRAELVAEADEFQYDKGEVKVHRIDFRKPRGAVYAVYSYVRFRDGAEDYEVMTREDIEGIRKRSRAGNDGPWVSDWNEMAKKTVIRRHAKRLPLSPEFRDALDKDQDVIDLPTTDYRIDDGRSRTERLADRLAPGPQSAPEPAPASALTRETSASQPTDTAPAEAPTAESVDLPPINAEDKSQAPPPDVTPTADASDGLPVAETVARCTKCKQVSQFAVFADGSAQCGSCASVFAELPIEQTQTERPKSRQTREKMT